MLALTHPPPSIILQCIMHPVVTASVAGVCIDSGTICRQSLSLFAWQVRRGSNAHSTWVLGVLVGGKGDKCSRHDTCCLGFPLFCASVMACECPFPEKGASERLHDALCPEAASMCASVRLRRCTHTQPAQTIRPHTWQS